MARVCRETAGSARRLFSSSNAKTGLVLDLGPENCSGRLEIFVAGLVVEIVGRSAELSDFVTAEGGDLRGSDPAGSFNPPDRLEDLMGWDMRHRREWRFAPRGSTAGKGSRLTKARSAIV